MSESQVVSAPSASELIEAVKRLLADGWKVKGISGHNSETGQYTQQMVK